LHPKDPQKALPQALKEAIIHVMGSSPVDVAKHRLSVVLTLHRKAAELATEEQQLKTIKQLMSWPTNAFACGNTC
jgi:hypothetical protein